MEPESPEYYAFNETRASQAAYGAQQQQQQQQQKLQDKRDLKAERTDIYNFLIFCKKGKNRLKR
jgi:hypothetical protein